ncbi:hypothetical protein ACIJYE_03315 [Candidatus Pelagibacter bacterium nBUS_30]|uniref:hypothetical protein n=1 Tax=Candidatus Pelagibacter bacterium nBUS_30 TaxID=3374191 RepID=UPI003EBD1D75
MKLLLYTHSDYNWVWKYWHQQTDKYLNNFQKICLLNSNSNFRDDYLVIKYDDKNTYKNRILSCINNLDDEDVVLFAHEDMFLYREPNFDILDQFKKMIKNDTCDVIKLIRAFENLDKTNIHKNLLINPSKQLFSIQPSILKIKTLKFIYKNVPGNNIWEFEANTNKKYLKNIKSFCAFEEILDVKRGKFHYNSSIFPYICTAVIKGKWNYKEYKKELFEIFYNKKFNYLSYYLSRINFY